MCVENVLASLTPDTLERMIQAIASERPSGSASVAVDLIAERFLAGCAFESGIERSNARILVGRKIAEQIAFIPGMSYIENE